MAIPIKKPQEIEQIKKPAQLVAKTHQLLKTYTMIMVGKLNQQSK